MFRANALPPCESRDSEGQSTSAGPRGAETARRSRGRPMRLLPTAYDVPSTPGAVVDAFRPGGRCRGLPLLRPGPPGSLSELGEGTRSRSRFGFRRTCAPLRADELPRPRGANDARAEFPTTVRAKMRDRSTPDRTDSPCFPRAGGLGLCRGLPVRSPQTTETEAGLSPMPPHCVFLRGRMSKPRTCHGSTCGFTIVVGKMTS